MSQAILNISVTTSGVSTANSELDALEKNAAKAEKSARSLSGAATLLTGALGGLLAGFSIGAIGNLADEWSDLNSRVNLATGSVEKGTAVMSRLQQMANATYSSLRTTTEAFIANSATLKALGKSTQQQIDYTEALNNALVVSGAKGQMAASVQDALAKAMALGALKGDQLNTVIANGGRIVELLAEKLGVSTLEVRKLGTEGKITGDIIYSALVGNMEKLREEADSMDATLGDAWQRMSNNALAFIGTLDQVSGSSGALSQLLLYLADNVDRLIIYAGTAAFTFGTIYVGAMAAAAIATGGLSGALFFLQRALVATGIGALVIVAGELIYRFVELAKKAGSFGSALGLLADVASEVWERIIVGANGLLLSIRSVWEGMKAGFLSALAVMQKAWADFLHNVGGSAMNTPGMEGIGVKIKGAAIEAGSALYQTRAAINEAEAAAKSFGDAASEAGKKMVEPLKSIEAIRKIMNGDDEVDLSGDTSKGIGGAFGGAGKGKGAGKKGGGGGSEKSRAAEKIAREMEHRLEALKQGLMTEEETVLAQYQKDLETLDWHLANKKISEQEYLEWKARVTREHEQEMQAIRYQSYADALSATGDLMGAMAQVVGGNNEKMLKAQRIFGAASALVSTYIGAAKALELPFPANLAAMAAVMAKGMALVAAIKSGSKSSASGGGSAGTTQSAAPQEKAPIRQMAEINVHGEVFNREQVIGLIEKINDVQKDGHVISWKGI